MTQYSGKVIRKTPVTPTQQSASGVWKLNEQAAAIRNNSWPVPGVPDPISRSVRLRSSASAYFNRTPASAGNRKTWTWSAWVKRGAFPSSGYYSLLGADSGGGQSFYISFDNSTQQLEFGQGATVYRKTTQVFRDPSAWYHLVINSDTTQATASNRLKIYVNGVQVTAFATSNDPSLNGDWALNNNVATSIGADIPSTGARNYFDGYLTEVNFIDGQALTPSSFGTTDTATGAWIPMPYTGTYGTNGFYLNFKDNTSTTTLGYDYSGNANNWTANNISLTSGSTYDSMLDVPTPWVGYTTTTDTSAVTRGNYAVLNPLLYMGSGSTKSNGNLRFAGGGTGGPPYNYSIYGTFTQNTGKWYWEITITTAGSQPFVGMFNTAINFNGGSLVGSAGPVLYGYDGQYYNETTGVSFGNTYTTNDVIGVAVDYDNNLIWFSKNGTWQNSGDPSSGTNGKSFGSGKTWGTGYVESGSSASPSTFDANFGQRPFSQTVPTGFKALNTQNLPAPTISNGANYMAASLYTGNGTTVTVTNTTNGTSFLPDFVWVKSRNAAISHGLFDSNRGLSKALYSNATNAEFNYGTGSTSEVYALNSNGFSVGSYGNFNANGTTYVGWQWQAGQGTTSSNTNGSITSTVSVNATAGFSVVTYTGDGSSSATVGHGLGVTPAMIICKSRSATTNWYVKHQNLASQNNLLLAGTDAQFNVVSGSSTGGLGNLTSSTTFSFLAGTANVNAVNANGATYVAYCFSAVAGYSAFGSYTGNGNSSDGPFVYLGFRPRFVLVKSSTEVNNWWLYDSSRSPYNAMNELLRPDLLNAEATQGYPDFLSNGWKIRNTGQNTSGQTYIYMAFAENPFKYSNAR